MHLIRNNSDFQEVPDLYHWSQLCSRPDTVWIWQKTIVWVFFSFPLVIYKVFLIFRAGGACEVWIVRETSWGKYSQRPTSVRGVFINGKRSGISKIWAWSLGQGRPCDLWGPQAKGAADSGSKVNIQAPQIKASRLCSERVRMPPFYSRQNQ